MDFKVQKYSVLLKAEVLTSVGAAFGHGNQWDFRTLDFQGNAE